MTPVLDSFRAAFRGIRLASSGRNFRIQVAAGLLAIAMGIRFDIGSVEWLAILTLTGLVLSMEILNTALERFVDWKGGEISPQARDVKDIAAGAVLWASLASLVVGLIIFVPRIIQLLH